MQFVKLRLAGFKSFIDPAELVIEQGLTGIVGSNGCGKSNLAEALRWVMGGNSYKTMRAMRGDDVIFAGTESRIAANFAEVALYLDNSDFSAPAAFNTEAELQISRRISRDGLSLYRINGREMRARDVQFLFADQATGAHSPAQVGQGRIGALIEARPQARRALLEEAAGIGGLQVRREAAEQRLRATDVNLTRVQEILADLDNRLSALQAQAAAAMHFRQVSAEIRRLEAGLSYLRRREAEEAVQKATSALNACTQILAEKHEQHLKAAQKAEALLEAVPPLQEERAAAGAARQRLWLEHERLEAEQKHAVARQAELEAHIEHIARDRLREEELLAETSAILQKINEEEQYIAAARSNNESGDSDNSLAVSVKALAAKREQAEQALAQAREKEAALKAAWAENESVNRFYADIKARLENKAAALKAALAELEQKQQNTAAAAAAAAEKLRHNQALCEQKAEESRQTEAKLAAQTKKQAAVQNQTEESCAALLQHQAQARALREIMESFGEEHNGRAEKAVFAQMEVEPGYELALSAALGEALQASTDPAAALFWRDNSGSGGDPPLPLAAVPLADFVRAPRFMRRALLQIGIIAPRDGAKLQQKLQTGQALVSLEGALWRWDGFSRKAAAPNSFALYVQQKRQWADVQKAEAEAAEIYAQNREQARQAEAKQVERAAILAKQQAEKENLQQDYYAAQAQAAAAERKQAEVKNRFIYMQENYAEICAALEENHRKYIHVAEAHKDLPSLTGAAATRAALQEDYAALQAEFIRKQADWQARQQQAEAAAARPAALAEEKRNWQKHETAARQRLTELAARRQAVAGEKQHLQQAAETYQHSKKALFDRLDKAEKCERDATEALAKAEAAQKQAVKAAHQAEQALNAAREARSRADERLNAALQRKSDIEKNNAARLGKIFMADGKEGEAANIAQDFIAADRDITAEEVEKRLEKIRAQRERLGAVNLRAEEESAALQSRHDSLARERDDIAAAQEKLRQAIGDLNREGRARLRAAFNTVNGRFSQLFRRLFGGGKAELHWLESDDPLNIGLEILVCPPGKKLENISLLSGGEQCLTALSLIFAVFLTNPAPICVLDEVDAPLDDYNVERYCRLLRDMTELTKTRFLIVTHNPITMAHMDRLFGVTMTEKGVSTLVSVDLRKAAEFAEN